MEDPFAVRTEAQLREVVGTPLPRVAAKERPVLDELDRRFIAASPLCLLATSDAGGRCDVSPRGDPPGFALVLDDATVVLPERPGNRRADSLRNVLANPHAGLLFLVPGRGDTLRVEGRAGLTRDPALLDRLVARGHRPRLALRVEVHAVFFHCAKAFLRSAVWDPATWAPGALPSRARIAQRLERPEASLAELERYYGAAYAERLYADGGAGTAAPGR